MKLLIGTNNPGKLEQMRSGLEYLDLECISPKELGITEDIEETGTTYKENALLKAQFYFEQSGLPTLTDDSGLEVDALPDLLGVHSRRLDKQTALSDEEWVEQFLNLMKNESNRAAAFVCTMCFMQTEQSPQFFTGRFEGTIGHSIDYPYKKGLPGSSLFIPQGQTLSYSQLEVEQPGFANHRSQALDLFANFVSMNHYG